MLREERGFTLVELMVVVMIIAILLALAIPTFLGFTQRANDISAKDAAALTIRVARGIQDDDGTYASVDGAALGAAEPSLTFVDGATSSTGPLVVSQEVVGADTLYVSVFSRAGACFFVRDDLSAGTTFGEITPAVVADCHAGNNGAVAFGPSW
jgi:type IV pilus assembly protein PilA